MLQQTTSTAVIPYFTRFLERFPDLTSLATAPLEEVYKFWAGLGYYSRARNIHKAAQQLAQTNAFPQSFRELIQYPGFGDYTARAVSSQAFAEKVGVVDGNVIRVLTRRYGLVWEHWKPARKRELQELADAYAQFGDPNVINQSLMELGATVCTPQSPTCFLCPLQKNCVAFAQGLVEELPLKKPRRETEIWHWEVELFEKNNKFLFIKNTATPFLKGHWTLPGAARQRTAIPKKYHFQHAITHHKIYVTVTRKKSKFSLPENSEHLWIPRNQLKEKVPFSIIQKTIDIGLGESF